MSIPTEAIEAAMSAADGLGRDGNNSWSDAAIMSAALTAAAPAIQAAALRDAADEIDRLRSIPLFPRDESTQEERADYHNYLSLTTADWLRARAMGGTVVSRLTLPWSEVGE